MTPAGWYEGSIPAGLTTARLRLVPLTEDHVLADLDAVLASAEYLRRWSDSEWPEPGFSVADNEADLRRHRTEHEERVAFTYSVQSVDGGRVIGCIYIHPARHALATRDIDVGALDIPLPGPDAAVVRGWIRRDEPADLLDHLVVETMRWMSGGDWSFAEVWWQAPEQTTDQLTACDRAGLIRRIGVPGAGTGWQLRSPAVPDERVTSEEQVTPGGKA